MSLITLIQLLVVVYLLVITLYILIRRVDIQNISLFLISLFVSLWSSSVVLINIFAGDGKQDTSLFFTRLAFSAIALTTLFVYLFSKVFPLAQDSKEKFQIKLNLFDLIVFVIVLALSVIASTTNLMVTDINIVKNIAQPIYGSFYLVNLLIVGGTGVVSIFNIWKKLQKSEGIQKEQVRYVLAGLAITAIFLFITNAFIPLVTGSSFSSQFGPISLTIFATFTSISILKYRLYDLKTLIGRIITYFILGVVIYASFFLFVVFFDKALGGVFTPITLSVATFISFVYGIVIINFYRTIQKFVLKKIFKINFTSVELVEKFLQLTSKEISLEKISIAVDEFIKQYLDIEKVNFLDKARLPTELIRFISESGRERPVILIDDLMISLANTEKAEFAKKLLEQDIHSIIPIYNSEILGAFLLSDRLENKPYTIEDIQLLSIFSNYIGALINKSILYEEVQNFNKTLEIKVTEATEEIREQKEQIEDAYKAERDRMNILSHELRTPLGTSRNAVSMLQILFKAGKLTPDNPSADKQFGIALENLRREVVLLERIFTVSQIRAGTIKIMNTEVHCNEIIQKAVEQFKHIAESKGVLTEMVLPKQEIIFNSDPVRVQEIMSNLYENSAKYTKQGSIKIGYEDLGDKVRFVVADTGIGIPKDEIPKLGEEEYYKVDKYLASSTKNDDKLALTRPDGTGMGMFVIKNLVKLLKGELVIQSELDKGSVFHIILPKQ